MDPTRLWKQALHIAKPKPLSSGDCFFVKTRLESRPLQAKNSKPLPSVGEVGSFPLCARQCNPETPTKESGGLQELE